MPRLLAYWLSRARGSAPELSLLVRGFFEEEVCAVRDSAPLDVDVDAAKVSKLRFDEWDAMLGGQLFLCFCCGVLYYIIFCCVAAKML